jgi:hypothetical protein
MGSWGTGCGSGTCGNIDRKERVVVASAYESGSVFRWIDAMDEPLGVGVWVCT